MKKEEKDKRINFWKNSVNYYQNELSLNDWEISCYEQHKPGVRGSQYGRVYSRQSSICYSKDWIFKSETTYDKIDRIAFHECCELLLLKIRIGLEMSLSDDIVDELIHKQIRLLENILYPKIKRKF